MTSGPVPAIATGLSLLGYCSRLTVGLVIVGAVISRQPALKSFLRAASSLRVYFIDGRVVDGEFDEQSLGVTLLQRTTRRMGLSEAGEAFFEHARKVVREAEAAEASVLGLLGEPVGTVCVAAPVFIAQRYLPSLLMEFMLRYPKVKVVLEATDRPVGLVTERVDVVFRVRQEIEDSADVVVKPFETVRRWVLASPGLAESQRRLDDPSQLSAWPSVAYANERVRARPAWWLEAEGVAPEAYEIAPRMLCNDLRTQIEAVLAGVGLGLLPHLVAEPYLATGALQKLLPGWTGRREVFHLLHRRPDRTLPPMRHLVAHLVTRLPEHFVRSK